MATSLSSSGGPGLTALKNRVFLVRHGQVCYLNLSRNLCQIHGLVSTSLYMISGLSNKLGMEIVEQQIAI